MPGLCAVDEHANVQQHLLPLKRKPILPFQISSPFRTLHPAAQLPLTLYIVDVGLIYWNRLGRRSRLCAFCGTPMRYKRCPDNHRRFQAVSPPIVLCSFAGSSGGSCLHPAPDLRHIADPAATGSAGARRRSIWRCVTAAAGRETRHGRSTKSGKSNGVETRWLDPGLEYSVLFTGGIRLATDARRTGSTMGRGHQGKFHGRNSSANSSSLSAKFDLSGNSCAHGAGRTA